MTTFPHIRRLEEAEEFSVTIAWNGPEDKPFYRAVLLSQSRAHLVEDRPFWGYVVISRYEYRNLIASLVDNGVRFDEGPYTGGETGYFMEINGVDWTFSAFLGDQTDSRAILEVIAGALEDGNREPVRAIIERLGE